MSTITNVLLGQMLGDAMGLPYETMPSWMIPQKLHSGLCFGKFMVTDDTEHAFFTTYAYLNSQNNPQKFLALLQKSFRFWFLNCPPSAGIATITSGFKTLFGSSVTGVKSQGNGPLMRAGVLGALVPTELLSIYCSLSTRMTHNDSDAEEAAYLYALLIASPQSAQKTIEKILNEEKSSLAKTYLSLAYYHHIHGCSLEHWTPTLKHPDKVDGWIVETLGTVARLWLLHEYDFREAIDTAIRLGGDTDTTAALLGALVASKLNQADLPQDWIENFDDIFTPENIPHLLEGHNPLPPWPILFLRNILQTGIILGHAMVMRPIWFFVGILRKK